MEKLTERFVGPYKVKSVMNRDENFFFSIFFSIFKMNLHNQGGHMICHMDVT